LKTLFIAFSFFLFTACNSDSAYEPTHEDIKISLEETEKSSPTEFLKANGTYRQNLIDQWVLEGIISNTASLAKYKDVVLRIVYYSKTQTEIGSEEKTLFEYFKPNTQQNFKIKTAGFEGTTSIGFEVISANAVD
jgi:hypothetical protein